MIANGPRNLVIGHISMTTPSHWARNWRHTRWQIPDNEMKGTLRFCGLVPDSCVIPLATKIFSGHGIARKLDDSNGCNDEDLNLMRGLSAWRGLGAWPALYSAVIKHVENSPKNIDGFPMLMHLVDSTAPLISGRYPCFCFLLVQIFHAKHQV